MSTNDAIAALAATRTAPRAPAVPAIPAQRGTSQPADQPYQSQESAEGGAASVARQDVPAPAVPGTAAVPVAEAALRRALAAGSDQDPHAFALDLLRSVEALIQASAPVGTPPDDIGAAAARLVERQGLLARLNETPANQPTGTWPTGVGPEDLTPKAVDRRL